MTLYMYMYGHYWEVKGGGVKGGADHVSQKIKPQLIYASPISLYLKKKNISLQSGKSTQLTEQITFYKKENTPGISSLKPNQHGKS